MVLDGEQNQTSRIPGAGFDEQVVAVTIHCTFTDE